MTTSNDLVTLFKRVEDDHTRLTEEDSMTEGGHDFRHVVAVAVATQTISEGMPDDVRRTALIAAVLHNTDRLYGRDAVDGKLRDYLNGISLSTDEQERIIFAVLQHSKPNDDNDPAELIILKDADRVACLMPSVIIRSGQFLWPLPDLDYRHVLEKSPGSTFQQPFSVLDNLHELLDWVDESNPKFVIRTPKALQIAAQGARFLRSMFAAQQKMQTDIGLVYNEGDSDRDVLAGLLQFS